jgi:hypothetical protein
LEDTASALVGRNEPPGGESPLHVLRWIAQTRPLLFHGSKRGDLDVLEPIRLSRDTTEFGDQQAVFATSDPVWATYFATLERGHGLRSTRNASYGIPRSVYPRWYVFSHTAGAASEGRFGDGWIYLVPRDTFQAEPPWLGLFDTAHWASPDAVPIVARVRVAAADFPLSNRVGSHREAERMLVTMLRAVRRGRA